MTYRGALLRLDGGRFVISTESFTFPREFDYGENADFLKVFIFSYVKFLTDSPLEQSSSKPLRVMKKFLYRLINEPIKETIKLFSGYADQILSNEFGSGSDSSIRVFHDFMRDTPIFKEYHQWIMTGRPELLKYVLSFLRFGKKLAYVDEEFNTTAFREWKQVEERLTNLQFSDEDTASLRTIISELISPLDTSYLFGRFGPGKVSEREVKDKYDKLERLSTDPKLDYAFFTSHRYRKLEEDMISPDIIQSRRLSSRTARLKFVPKDITKSRSICMEPNSYMFFQQEVQRWMRESMDRSLISRFCTIDDQRPNQLAAIHGSLYMSSDTIDLSSASDSVHYELVKKVFPSDWLFYMVATRSLDVELPDGKVVKVAKFAPMGSAICFPTQCILFTAICLYGYHLFLHGKTAGGMVCTRDDVASLLENSIFRNRSVNTPFRKRMEPPVVYGDDIIVDSRPAGVVISTLERLGFRVNVAKSFMNASLFRESCGVYAYEGEDVTPVIFRIPFLKKGRWGAKEYASVIGGINQFNSHGYNNVASFLINVLKDYGFKHRIPFTTNPLAFGILTGNKHPVPVASLRWNANWQVYEEKIQGIGPRKIKKNRPFQADHYDLGQWWRTRVDGGSSLLQEGKPSIRPQETRIVPVWARYE